MLVFSLRLGSCWLDRATCALLLLVASCLHQLVVRKFCRVAISTELFPDRQQFHEHAPLYNSVYSLHAMKNELNNIALT